MKEIPLVIVLLLVFARSGSAQQVFPTFQDQPQWNVYGGYGSFGSTYYSTAEWTYVTDTAFCGEVYSKANIWLGSGPAFIRVDDEQVFLRRSMDCADGDLLLYDFSLSVGDTVLCASEHYEVIETPFWVVGIDTVDLFGVSRRRFDMRYSWNPQEEPENWLILEMEWVEGIGSLLHPFHPVAYTWHYGHGYSTLLCYWEQEVQLYQHPEFDTCTASYSFGQSITEQDPVLATVGPNPFQESMILSMHSPQSFVVEAFSADGRLIERTFHAGTTVAVGSGLTPGVYLLRISQNGHVQRTRVIKTSP
jgi:hypothetical protein